MLNRDAPAPMDGEQGVPDVNEDRFTPWQKYLALAAVVALGGGMLYLNLASSDDTQEEEPEVVDMAGSNVPARIFDTEPALVSAVPEPETEPAAVVETPPEVVASVQPEVIYKYVDRPEPAMPRISKGRSRAMMQAGQSATSSGQALQGGQQSQGLDTGGSNSAASRQVSDGVERGFATTLPNTDRLLTQGLVIPCTLDGAINTQLAGAVSCTVSRDMWSADNSRILVAKGSRANGTYQIETTSAAVVRIGVQWGRILTTDDQVANLGSPATDRQGAAGIEPNYVNYHFWARFGSALAVSLIDGVFNSIGTTGDATGDVVINSASGTSSSLASQVLASTINLPATRKANRGSEVAIYLRRDIEFEALP